MSIWGGTLKIENKGKKKKKSKEEEEYQVHQCSLICQV